MVNRDGRTSLMGDMDIGHRHFEDYSFVLNFLFNLTANMQNASLNFF